jgi:hypothetical protein
MTQLAATDIGRIHDALCLMNSMIQCGEKHSETSSEIFAAARAAVDNLRAAEALTETRVLLGGSRAYGTPREDSDWDLVMLTDAETSKRLREAFTADGPEHSGRDGGLSITVGKLNLLIETDRTNYDVWAEGIRQLKALAPVPRSQAVELFERLEADAKASPF